jgi:RIO-like serine/threonine protein kinase
MAAVTVAAAGGGVAVAVAWAAAAVAAAEVAVTVIAVVATVGAEVCAVAAIRVDLVVEQCLELAGVCCHVRVAEVDAAAQRVLDEVAKAAVVAAVVGASWDLGALWVIVIARSGSGLGSRVFVGGGGLSDPAAGVPSAGPTR